MSAMGDEIGVSCRRRVGTTAKAGLFFSLSGIDILCSESGCIGVSRTDGTLCSQAGDIGVSRTNGKLDKGLTSMGERGAADGR